MSGERDQYGYLIDRAEAYEEFLRRLYDIIAENDLIDAPKEAVAKLHEARLMLVADFKLKFPGKGQGRATWE